MTQPRVVSRSTVVTATPAEVFAVIADPRRHADLDGSGSVRSLISGPDRLSAGARFSVRMKIGVPYPIRNTVVEFEEDRRIAWRHVGRHVWRWEVAPVEGGTEVTESFDWSGALSPAALEKGGYPARNARHIEASLRRVEELFGTPAQPKRPVT